MKKKTKKWDSIKAQKSAQRRAHFAAGGTPAMWRGRPARLDESSSKARKNKLACRKYRRGDDE